VHRNKKFRKILRKKVGTNFFKKNGEKVQEKRKLEKRVC
jgi:hypothetical protein